MFETLKKINQRPEPFSKCTASELWTDDHTSAQMLSFHLNTKIDVSSRNIEFIDRSVEWIVSRFNVGGETRIADFGCGPGLYASRLAKKQAMVTGIDFSHRSIAHARKVAAQEHLNIRYVHQNYLDFETEDCFDLIMMIMCDFCALSPDQRHKMLKKFHTLLKPGGRVLLDVYSLNGFEQREETATYETDLLNGFWSPDKYYGFLNTFKYAAEKVVLDQYTIVEAQRTRTIYNWLQYFTSEALEKEFASCTFTIEAFYGDVAGRPFDPKSNEFAVIAKTAA